MPFNILIHNESSYSTQKLVDLVTFLVEPIPNIFRDKEINIFYKNGKYDDEWDGTCYYEYEERKIEIILPTEDSYPKIYEINSELEGFYQDGIHFESYEEFVFFLTAHETYHIIKEDNTKTKLNIFSQDAIKKLKLRVDEESECDIFALVKLNEWRNAQM